MTLLVVVGSFFAFVCVQRSAIGSYDGKMMISVAQNLIEHGSISTSGDFLGISTPYSTYGIGVSIALLPFVALQRALHPTGGGWITLLNPMVLAAAAGLLFRFGIDLGWRVLSSAITATSFALLTSALWQSTEMLSEPAVTLATIAALHGLVRWQQGGRYGPLELGLAVAAAIVFRADAILLVGLVGLLIPLFVPWSRLRARPRDLLLCGAPVLAAFGWTALYNWYRYESVTKFGYEGYGFTTPLGDGLEMIMLRPGKGFFYYHPLLLAAVPGVWLLWKKHRALSVAVVLLFLCRTVFYAKWTLPSGGVAWGPRLLFPLCGVLAVPLGATVDRVVTWHGARRVVGGAILAGLATLSAGLAVLSIWVPYEQFWNQLTVQAPGETPEEVYARVVAYETSFRQGHIVGNFHLMDNSIVFPLEHWRDGPDAVGVIVLIAAIAAFVRLFLMAFSLSRERSPTTA